MSSAATIIDFPVRREYAAPDSLGYDIVFELAAADDLASGLAEVTDRIRRDSGAAGVEWWGTSDDGGLERVAVAGTARGRRHDLPLGRAGRFVLYGGSLDAHIESALISLTPILQRRAAEERLFRTAIELAQRNRALEDFASLVAHELKTPLQAALVADDPSSPVEDALDLVDTLLEAAQNEPAEGMLTSAAEILDQTVADLRAEVEITMDLAAKLPLPPGPLRVILRNLLANAVAAGARHVHVASVRSAGSWRLLLDDDGVGLESDRYAAGSGLGLSLSRRAAARFGGELELAPLPSGGTRATLEFAGVRQ